MRLTSYRAMYDTRECWATPSVEPAIRRADLSLLLGVPHEGPGFRPDELPQHRPRAADLSGGGATTASRPVLDVAAVAGRRGGRA